MKKQLLILLILLHFFDTFCQDIKYEKLWIGFNKISNYEVEEEIYSDTANYLSSVLWFSEKEINIIFFSADDNNCSLFLDTIKLEYQIVGDKIIGYDSKDTFLINLGNNFLSLKFESEKNKIVLTYILPEDNINKMEPNTLEKSKLLLIGKWEIVLMGDTVYEEFLQDGSYHLSSDSHALDWSIFKILDYYFFIVSDCLHKPLPYVIKSLNSVESEILLFQNGKVNEYKRTKIK